MAPGAGNAPPAAQQIANPGNQGPRDNPASGQLSPSSIPGAASPEVGPSVRLRHGLGWYEDAPEAARAAARAAGKLMLVDLWAPWCHTCLSMQNFVITAESLPAIENRFVLLSVDTERESNAAFLKQLPVGVWPTFYVVEPDGLQVAGRWLGAASPGQLVRFLSESDRAAALRDETSLPHDDPLRDLVRADRLATGGDFAAAAEAYGKALTASAADWPRRPETLVAQMTALWKAKAYGSCLELAKSAIHQTGSSASAVDFAYYALECSSRAPSNGAAAALVRQSVERQLDPLCHQGSTELSPDDRADACDKLSSARTALGDRAGARRATEERLSVLTRALAGKPADVAMTYDWALTETLILLGRAEEALEAATLRERARPDNYNPPHNQAKSYKALGKWNEGLAAIERALTLAYGPRRVGLMTLKADLLLGAGRREEAMKTLEAQLAAYRALPEGQKQPAAEARVEQRLTDMQPRSLTPSP